MTITTTAGQASRMAAAVGVAMRLGRDATAQEVKDYWIGEMRRHVLGIERDAAQAALAAPAAFDPT